MELEVGKTYRTRNGNKVTVIHILTEDTPYPVMSLHHNSDGTNHYATYTLHGSRYGVGTDEFDIVEEWVDEPFKITEPGLYEMSNGDQAYIYFICPDNFEYPVKGWTQRSRLPSYDGWAIDGTHLPNYGEDQYDIIRKL